MKTVLNPHLVNKAVDIYATTPNVQHNFVADELGISYKTLLKLRKDADFWKKVWDTYLVTYEADVLDIPLLYGGISIVNYVSNIHNRTLVKVSNLIN